MYCGFGHKYVSYNPNILRAAFALSKSHVCIPSVDNLINKHILIWIVLSYNSRKVAFHNALQPHARASFERHERVCWIVSSRFLWCIVRNRAGLHILKLFLVIRKLPIVLWKRCLCVLPSCVSFFSCVVYNHRVVLTGHLLLFTSVHPVLIYTLRSWMRLRPSTLTLLKANGQF